MHALESAITKKIVQDQLVRTSEHTIVVGVSGGPDSVALLHLLLPLKTELGVSLVAAYIDHGLRPQEADEEKRFVNIMCENIGIACDTIKVNVRDHAKQEKQSLEHAARELRYSALRKLKEEHKASLVAVAHTADDQAEEILIRLLRGSGRKGLSGMEARSNDIIRPLLSVEKETLLEYLKEKNIKYCVDSSNSDMRFLRNRVRHRLIPYLEENFDKGIRRALCKTADSLAEDENLLQDLTELALAQVLILPDNIGKNDAPVFRLDRIKFTELSVALQRRVVEKLLWKLESKAKYSHILQIVHAAHTGTTNTEIHLSRGLRVGVQREYLEFLYPKGHAPWRGKLYA